MAASKIQPKQYAGMFFKEVPGKKGEFHCQFDECQAKYAAGTLEPTISKNGYGNCVSHLEYVYESVLIAPNQFNISCHVHSLCQRLAQRRWNGALHVRLRSGNQEDCGWPRRAAQRPIVLSDRLQCKE